ncbi:KAP family P-loop domain protein [Acinetobacter wuhouensis]|uniref:P-loop NTPase fold protein n=1 Tax=Acinetobacter wuhouensis TaxID=1879050 RepID=UPI0010239B42|nr:P-loop NTPase fold protein [Acinetobacter wuhouensis]RZG71142.1 KAP family P-loop domain protein [Acinetobacter wuhouensis]
MMLNEKQERLKELLENNIKNEKVGTAIAITGSWGIGKTYFWNKFLEGELSNERIFSNEKIFNRKYAYVSLFGIESLSDLKTQIYGNIESYHSAIEIPKWLKGLPSIFKDTRVTQLGINAPVKLIDNLLFNQVKDAIICFDDFERMSNKLDIKDVMGLANQLKLEKNSQIILILDESKTEDKNKEKYAEYKEKLIDETIKITSVEPLIRENAKDIDEKLVELMVEFAEKLEIHNFRFFQKIIKLYRQFLAQLPNEVASSTKEIILIRVLEGYFIEDFGLNYEFSWENIKLVLENGQKDWSKQKIKTYEALKSISYYFVFEDQWCLEYKKWFEQKDGINLESLQELAKSDFISEKNQNLKNKLWEIFDRRFNLVVNESDFEFIAKIGKECINIETIFNTSVAYEFIKKYLEDESKPAKFKQDVLSVIDADIGGFIKRKQGEVNTWGYKSNYFYDYIDKLAKNYNENKTLKEVVSHFLQYEYFEDDDKQKLKDFSLEDWYLYLTIDIYQEQFFIDKNKTIVAYLNKLISIKTEDFDLKNTIIDVLNRIGNESEFKRRYIQDIIENHLD